MRQLFIAANCVVLGSTLATAQVQRHALDPLDASEIQSAVAIVKRSGRLSDQARFGTITVQRQEKRAGNSRAARVLGFDWTRNEAFLGVVDLVGGRLASWTVVDSEPPMRLLIIRRAEEIAHGDPRWVAAMRARGVDTGHVSILPGMSERQKLPRKGEDRVVHTFAFRRDVGPDEFSVPGIQMQVNLTQGRIESFSDEGAGKPERDSATMRAMAAPRPALAPLRVTGSSVRLNGNEITWDRWTLKVGVDPRLGPEVHDVAYTDAGRRRPVLYSGAISEIIAPYGDPKFATWYPRDEGDYGMGIYSLSSAVPLNDVPENALFLPSTMHDHLGRPIRVERAIAVYERDGGLLWRHANQSRRARQLVVSGHSTIDNYDYQFNWILSQDGTIESEVVLSGVMNINPTQRKIDTTHAGGHSSFGHLVAPGINAPNHQHFFSYRLDLDVDGEANTLYEVDTYAPPKGSENPKGELFAMRTRPILGERDAALDVSFAASRNWRVSNTHRTNGLGQFTSYTLVPGAVSPAYPLAGSDPRTTAGFIAHQLWATPYAPEELFAAGEFQNLGRENQGLPSWTTANRSLDDKDVVLWYTLGVLHVPRAEDWPFMPAHRGSFRLVPTSFFTRSPVLDVPARKP